MSDFMSHFNSIPDPRIERCKRHSLMDILFLSISAVLCGAEGWEEIEDFGHARLDWLKKYFPFYQGGRLVDIKPNHSPKYSLDFRSPPCPLD